MPAIRVVDRIQDQGDFAGPLEDGQILKYDITTDTFVLAPRTYVHNQLVSSDTWLIIHNMGKFPSVAVTDSAGTVVFGDVQHMSETTVVVRFSAPFGGQAYLN